MRPRVLFILQLPPPYHGASIANEFITQSDLIKDAFDTRIIDIKTADSIASIGKFSISKVFVSVKLFFTILGQLLNYKPQLVYFTIAPAGFAFYRDAFYILLIKLFRSRLIIHFHGKGIKNGTERSSLFRFLCKKILSGTYCIHLSNILAGDVPDYNIRKRYFIPYGVPITIPDIPAKNEGGKPQILFLSNYVITKGILDLVDAIGAVVATHPNLQVRLVGNAADISTEDVKKYISNKKLAEYISVCGPKYKEEKSAELKNADIFVLPTYYANEAFPVSLLEAMQYGLAIISTREGGIPDMIENNATGLLVNKRDVKDLAKKIIYLLDHVPERKKLGEKAREVFLERYTLSVFEQHVLKVINDVLSEK